MKRVSLFLILASCLGMVMGQNDVPITDEKVEEPVAPTDFPPLLAVLIPEGPTVLKDLTGRKLEDPSVEKDIPSLLSGLKLKDPLVQKEFFEFVAPENLNNTVDCLIKDGGLKCDNRTSAIRGVIQELSKTAYQCITCEVQMQRIISILMRSMRTGITDPKQCTALENALKLTEPFCY